MDTLRDDEDVKKLCKKEKRVFSNSIWQMSRTFQAECNPEQKQLILTKEDMLKKFFHYIEYWKQK